MARGVVQLVPRALVALVEEGQTIAWESRQCILADSPGAGELFPQPWRDGQRLDDVLGAGPWLIAREAAAGAIALDDARLTPFRADLARWLDKRSADAVLVRADRTVFGTGAASVLQDAWTQRLAVPVAA